MEKQEMLDLLLSIQNKLENMGIEEKDVEHKAAKLEEIIANREQTKRELKYLEERLASDENYLDRTPYLYDESRRFNLEDLVDHRKQTEESNNAEIARVEGLIADLRENLDAKVAESKAKAEELTAELEEDAAVLRESVDVPDDEFNRMREEYAAKVALRDEMAGFEDRITEELTQLNNELEDDRSNAVRLAAQTQEAEEMLARFDRQVANRSIIDRDAKKADEDRATYLEEMLRYYDSAEDFLVYDYSRVLTQLINDYRADRIDQDEVRRIMTEVGRHLEPALLEKEAGIESTQAAKDYASTAVSDDIDRSIDARVNSEELENNRSAMQRCIEEITALEEKLSDDANYIVSPFMVERDARNLKRINTIIDNNNVNIANYQSEIQSATEDIATADALIAEERTKINSFASQLRRLGPAITPEQEQNIAAEIRTCGENIEYLQESKAEAGKIIDHNKHELEYLTVKTDRFKIVSKNLEERLRQSNHIDMSARRLDQNRLASLKASLTALENRERFIGVSMYEDLYQIIKSGETKAPEMSDKDKEAFDNYFENIETSMVKNTMEESKEKSKDEMSEEDKALFDSYLNNIKNNEKEEEMVVPASYDPEDEPEYEEESKKDRKKRKVKWFSPEENVNLTQKAHKKGFIKKLIGFLALLAALVALCLGLYKACSPEKASNLLKDAQENPTKYEQMTEDEIKDELTDDEVKETIEEKDSEKDDKKHGTKDTNDNKKTPTLKDETKVETITQQVIDTTPIDNTTNTNNDTIVTNIPISEEEQKQILIDQGIIPSDDIPPVTTDDNADIVYDGDNGEFIEDNSNGNNGGNTNPSTEDISWSDDEFVEDQSSIPNNTTPNQTQESTEDTFVEEKTETTQEEAPVTETREFKTDDSAVAPNLEDSLTVKVNNGETLTVDLGGTTYELNNSEKASTEGAESFIDLDGTRSITEDSEGAVEVEIGGEDASNMYRESELTKEDLEKLRQELAEQYGVTATTQEEIDAANEAYQATQEAAVR